MDLRKRSLYVILAAIIAIVFGLGVVYGQYLADKSESDIFNKESLLEKNQNSEIVVDIKGAVLYPGAYSLPSGSRVKELLVQAVLLESADINGINQARVLKDEEVIIVPSIQKEAEKTVDKSKEISGSQISDNDSTTAESTTKININTASLKELESLPGIGPAKASSIINYRLEHGCYTSIEDIMKVSGIGKATFAKIKELITVD